MRTALDVLKMVISAGDAGAGARSWWSALWSQRRVTRVLTSLPLWCEPTGPAGLRDSACAAARGDRSCLANWVPARWAAGVDPVRALRVGVAARAGAALRCRGVGAIVGRDGRAGREGQVQRRRVPGVARVRNSRNGAPAARGGLHPVGLYDATSRQRPKRTTGDVVSGPRDLRGRVRWGRRSTTTKSQHSASAWSSRDRDRGRRRLLAPAVCKQRVRVPRAASNIDADAYRLVHGEAPTGMPSPGRRSLCGLPCRAAAVGLPPRRHRDTIVIVGVLILNSSRRARSSPAMTGGHAGARRPAAEASRCCTARRRSASAGCATVQGRVWRST